MSGVCLSLNQWQPISELEFVGLHIMLGAIVLLVLTHCQWMRLCVKVGTNNRCVVVKKSCNENLEKLLNVDWAIGTGII